MKFVEFNGSKRPNHNETKATLVKKAMVAHAPLLNYIDWEPIVGNATVKEKGKAMTGHGQTRQIGSDFTSKTYTPETETIMLTVMGDTVQTDMANVRRAFEYGVGAEHAASLEEYGHDLGLFLQTELIIGDGSGSNIKGLKTLMPTGRIHKLATNGHTVKIGTSDTAVESQAVLLRAIVNGLGKIKSGASCIIMNSETIALLWDIGKSYMKDLTVKDFYDNVYQVNTFKGVPIVDAGYTNDQRGSVITNTETCGSNNKCTSIYIVKYGMQGVKNITSAGGLEALDLGVVDNFLKTRIEFDAGQGLLDERAVWKIEGLSY